VGAAETDRQIIQKVTILWRSGSTLSTRSGSNELRLVKYADPEYYQAFLDELLQRSTKTAINCDLSIESTSGKV